MKLILFLLSLFVVSSLADLDSDGNEINPTFARINGYRLLQFNETFQRWYTAEEATVVAENCARHKGGYMDITDHPNLSPYDLMTVAMPLPSRPRYENETKKIIDRIAPNQIKEFIDSLTQFRTRYYTTETGYEAAEKIFNTFKTIAKESGRNDIEVKFFQHSWKQPSVVAKILGNGPLSGESVIISAHEDSINFGSIGTAPGADDDASGVSNVLEAFRTIVNSGFKPRRSLEFHTYAAEEIGLRGSQDVAAYYQSKRIPVHAHMQLDMTMYTKTPQYIAVMTDYVDPELTEFIRKLIITYTNRQYLNSRCGYGCSDHASWTKAGFRSSFPFETEMDKDNPYIHSANDLFEHLTLEHGVEFTKLAIGFLVELSFD